MFALLFPLKLAKLLINIPILSELLLLVLLLVVKLTVKLLLSDENYLIM